MAEPTSDVELFLDIAPEADTMEADVRIGLSAKQPWLPSKYFYDARGSDLFDQICELDEYYPTRTERRILERILPELNALFPDPTVMLEYGSGSSTKTRLLLEHLGSLRGYVPIDISRDHLLSTGRALKTLFPRLSILPVCADYGQRIPFDWDAAGLGPLAQARRMVFFPGSTIGNFTRETAADFLMRMRDLVGAGGFLLIGVDLVKDESVLHAAYNDAQGVTAAFNRNILHHINDRLGSLFNPDAFRHEAIWDADHERIEMRLIANEDVTVRLGHDAYSIERDSFIRTEYSHKYRLDSFAELAGSCGFSTKHVWTDENQWFAVQLLEATPSTSR